MLDSFSKFTAHDTVQYHRTIHGYEKVWYYLCFGVRLTLNNSLYRLHTYKQKCRQPDILTERQGIGVF